MMQPLRCLKFSIIAFLLWPVPPLAWANLTTEPVLKLETEQHTAPIRRIDTDRDGRFAVTGSNDKTARVWSLPDGKLLTVLRPPVGPGNQGKIYAVAMSPDGLTVAAGGWMSASGTDEIIYLFDRKTGRLLHRLTGLGNVIDHLAFSPDGRYLAAGLGEGGVRVWQMSNRKLVLKDTDYKSDVNGLVFASDGRLATTSYDGAIRLYSTQFKLLAKEPAPSGKQPYGIAFSPDDQRLAIGYKDTPKVSVVSAKTLRLEFEPDTRGISGGNLMTVTWSTDGQFLYAGGRYQDQSGTSVVRWSSAGRGTRTILPAADNSVMSLRSYGRSGVLFGTADPALGTINDQGQTVIVRGPEIPDLRNKTGSAFTVSSDGFSVRFGLEYGDQKPIRFDLIHRQTLHDAPATSDLQPPRIEATAMKFEDWKDATTPKLNGKALTLQSYEISRSLTIAPDGQRFVLGTEWWLRLFDREGREQWQRPVPGAVWGVNISGDGRLIVAAYGDGTVR